MHACSFFLARTLNLFRSFSRSTFPNAHTYINICRFYDRIVFFSVQTPNHGAKWLKTRRKQKIRYWRNENTFNTRLITSVSSNKIRWHSLHLAVFVHMMERIFCACSIEWSHLAHICVSVCESLFCHSFPLCLSFVRHASVWLLFFCSFLIPCACACVCVRVCTCVFRSYFASVWVNNNSIEPVYLFLLLHSWERFCV